MSIGDLPIDRATKNVVGSESLNEKSRVANEMLSSEHAAVGLVWLRLASGTLIAYLRIAQRARHRLVH